MTPRDLIQRRLHNQHLTQRPADTPNAVVAWLGAVQAQDYPAAKWAVGQRLDGATDAAVEQAFAAGAILRTHVLRPTWHFVTPADIRWMLALTAPRVHAQCAYWYRRLELDAAAFATSETALTRALQGGKQLTRAELIAVLEQAGIALGEDLRFSYLMMHAELEGLLCCTGRRGSQFTFGLLEELAPAARILPRAEALAELTRRYFTSHGPATVPDFVWWSGLTVADARAGLAAVASHLVQEVVDDQTYWFSPQPLPATDISPGVHLLPNYDEYVVGYTDRSALFDAAHVHKLDPRGNILFSHTVVLDGRIVGAWKRTVKKNAVALDVALLTPLDAAQTAAFDVAAAEYGRFLGLAVVPPVLAAPPPAASAAEE